MSIDYPKIDQTTLDKTGRLHLVEPYYVPAFLRLSEAHPSAHLTVDVQKKRAVCGRDFNQHSIPALNGERLCGPCSVWLDRNCDKTLNISHWSTPATEYPLETVGTARFGRRPQQVGLYPYWGMDGFIYWRLQHRIQITDLQLLDEGKWSTWMVDDPPQWRAMQIYATHALGKVLVAGLGLGLVCHELVKNPLVEEVTVVERNPDVITLMQSHTPEGVTVVNQDFETFVCSQDENWDTIIVDLWVAHGVEEKMALFYSEVLPLHSKIAEHHPHTSVTYHGFQNISDIPVATKEMVELLTRLSSYGED